MQLGRGFLDGEDSAGRPEPVIVVGYQVWDAWFARDPSLVGKQIRLSGVPFTVVGVASQNFRGTMGGPTDVWIPLAARPLLRPNDPSVTQFLTSANYCCSDYDGPSGAWRVAEKQARAEVQLLLGQFRQQFTTESPRTEADRTAYSRIVLTSTAWMDNPGRKRKE